MNFFNHKGEIEAYQINMHMNHIKKVASSSYEPGHVKEVENCKIGSFDCKEALDWQGYTDEEAELTNKDTFLIDIPSSVEIEMNDEQKLEEMYKCYEKNFNKEKQSKQNDSNDITRENQNYYYDQDKQTNASSEDQTHSYFINMYKPKKETKKEAKLTNQGKEIIEINKLYQRKDLYSSMNNTQLTALQDSQKSLQDFYINAATTNSQQTIQYGSKQNFGDAIQTKSHPMVVNHHSKIEPNSSSEYNKKYQPITNQGLLIQGTIQEVHPQEHYTEEVTTPNLNCSIPKEEIITRIVKECTNQNNQRNNNTQWKEEAMHTVNPMSPTWIRVNIDAQNHQEMIQRSREAPVESSHKDKPEQRGNSMSGFITRRTLDIHSTNQNAMGPTMHQSRNQTNERNIPFSINPTKVINNNLSNNSCYGTMDPGSLQELYSLKNQMNTMRSTSMIGMRDTRTLQPQSNVLHPTTPSYVNGKEFINAHINQQYNTKHMKDILPEPKLYTQQNFDVPEIMQGITTQHTNGIVNDCNADTILKYKDTWRLVPNKRCSLNQQFNNQAAQNSLNEFQKRLDESNALTKQNIMNANFNALTGELTMNHKKEDHMIDPNKVYDYKDVHTSFPSYNHPLVNEKIAQINTNLMNNHTKNINSFNSMNPFHNGPPQNEINRINSYVSNNNKQQETEITKNKMTKKQNVALCGDTQLKNSIKEFVSGKMKDYFNIDLFNHYV